MKCKSNIGVTMVEVLIALAIFLILLMPLVSALMTGMRSTSTAKETQERNEYARNLMEHVKEMPSNVLLDKDEVVDYFTNLGATGVTCDVFSGSHAGTGNKFERYEIRGTSKFGIKDDEYSYVIEVSNQDYADVSLLPAGYINPNSLKNGVVEDFDRMDIALISAPFANYDYPAFDSLITKKLDEYRKRQEKNNVEFNPEAAMNEFKGDKGKRNIEIQVSGDDTNGYTVKCVLGYSDDCSVTSSLSGTPISNMVGTLYYVPYVQKFEKLPNIYLMYNSCVYNGKYADDMIELDISGLTNKQDVNLFVVATAEDYQSDVKTAASQEGITLKNDKLYRPVAGMDRGSQSVKFIGRGTDADKFLHVYHNIGDLNKGVTVSGMPNASYSNGDFCEVGSLNDAQNSRGLYKVKVWMQKTSAGAIDMTNDSPVLQGTRGGDEIE